MAPTATSKKRKREDSDVGQEISIQLSDEKEAAGSVGPLLVSFPSITAPPSTPFYCFAKKSSQCNALERMIVVGETPSIEFISNEEETQRVANSGCRYLLAVHNRKTGSVSILPSATTPHVLSRTVKALKSIPAAPAPSALEYKEARTALGETFGTKKAKAVIRAQERNRVDVSAMEGVMEHVMDGIEKGVKGLPTELEAKEATDSNRLVPPFSTTATDPADVYPLDEIIPKTEWKIIDTSPYDTAESNLTAQSAWMPMRRKLLWRNSKINAILTQPSKDTQKMLKLTYYISAMFLFRSLVDKSGKGCSKKTVQEKMEEIPAIIVDSLLSRFTETSRSSNTCQLTPTMQTKLLTHIFALCLHADNFATNFTDLATDLSLPPLKVRDIFRSLGCTIKVMTERDLSRYQLSKQYDGSKMALLTAPVKFPAPRRKKAARK